MLSVEFHRFQQRTVFISGSYDPCLSASRRDHRQRPHMLFNNVFFSFRKIIFPGSIPKRYTRMVKTMKALNIPVVLIMPVIKKIIMEQRSSHKIPLIAGYVQLPADRKTIDRHINAMTVYCHISMLNIISCFQKIIGHQDIVSVFL